MSLFFKIAAIVNLLGALIGLLFNFMGVWTEVGLSEWVGWVYVLFGIGFAIMFTAWQNVLRQKKRGED